MSVGSWEPFASAIQDASSGQAKIKSRDYAESGALPVVDQGQGLVGGYTDDVEAKCTVPLPVIVFGDHTKAFKFVDFDFAIGADGVKVLKPNAGIDEKYAYHYLRQVRLPGNAGYSRHFKFLKQVDFPMRSMPEQKRIAAILDKADAIRKKRKEAIRLTEELLKSVFLDMFGDPVTNPKGWDVKPLGDSFELKHGFAFKSTNFVPEGKYVLLTPGNFFEKGGFRHRGEKQRYHDDPVPPEYVLEKGDLLVAMTEQAPGLLGSPILVPQSGRFLHNQRLGKVVKKANVDSRFIFGLMNVSSVRTAIHHSSTGTKVKHTSPTKIGDLRLGLPSYDDQVRYGAVFDRVRARLRAQEVQLHEADSLFGSLSQQFFALSTELEAAA